MLSPAEQSLVHRESRLPGLEKLLDESQFLEAMRKAAPESGLVAAHRTYIRHKPGMNCLVRYELIHPEGMTHVYAKTFAVDAHTKVIKAVQRPFVEGLAGAGRIILKPDLIQVCTFPNDDKLKILYKLGDTEKKQRLISRIIKQDASSFRGAQLETLQYKPERRYVARLSGYRESYAAVKFYSGHAFQQAYQNAKHVSRHTDHLFPELIDRSRRHHVLTFEWIHGTTLSDILLSPDPDMQWIDLLAGALSGFHTPEHQGLSRQDNSVRAAKLAAQARGIGFLVPALEQRANKLVAGLSNALGSLPDLSFRIHNDFYAKQVLCTDRGIRLVDSDDIGLGHPAADLGLFIAHLERNVISGGLDPTLADKVRQSLLNRYQPHHNCEITGAIDLFTAIGLVQLTHHPYRTCQADWSALMAQILDRADFYLRRHRPKHPTTSNGNQHNELTRVEDPFNSREDPAMRTIADALNPQIAASLILKCIKSPGLHTDVLQLRRIRTLRYKPERRCVIEYTFLDRSTAAPGNQQILIGKKRARGLDTRTYELNDTLYANGFERGCSDGIEIPEPLGCVPELHMWIQRSIDGHNPFSLLSGADATDMAKRLAELLFKLHSTDISVKRRHSLHDEMTILESQLTGVSGTHRHWQKRIHSILSACEELAGTALPARLTGIHRDFYHDQVLVNGKTLYLLDLDLFCMGDPALDIGNFIAHIEEQSLRQYDNAYACKTATSTLIDHYCQLAGYNLCESIELYSTLSFVRHIAISQRIKKRNKFTDRIIDLCEEKLAVQNNYLYAL